MRAARAPAYREFSDPPLAEAPTTVDEVTAESANPLGLIRTLEASDRFPRDTPLGGIFHHGKISFREVSRTNSLHVTIDGGRVSAHVDSVSPLKFRSDGSIRYAFGPVVVHNLSGLASDIVRRLRGRAGEQRCQLHCETVWVDDDDPAADAGSVDAALVDAGSVDAGSVDAALVDAALVDAGLVDAGSVDAGSVDAALVDAALVDAGSVDAESVDAESPGGAGGGPPDGAAGASAGVAAGDVTAPEPVAGPDALTLVPAGRPRSDAAVLVPFTLLDEAIHLLDTEAAPWSVQLELRVRGSLDERRLRGALDKALALHPMARARKAPSPRTRRHDNWEIPAAPDLDPLRTLDCPDDAALDAARAELQSLAVPLAESPPLRARLARHPGGDVLMFNFNHAATDGFGALRVVRSVARAYSGIPDAPPDLDFLDARDLPVRLTVADPSTRLRRRLVLAARLGDLVAPPARLAIEGATDATGYGLHHVSLSKERTESLKQLRHAGTVNDVLLATLHRAIAGWNAEHGAPCGRIGVLVPANLRPEHWRDEMVGNFSLPARVSTNARTRRTRRATLARVNAQTNRKRSTGMGTAFVELLRRSPALPLWAKQALVGVLPATGDRLVDTAMLSNLGRIDDLPSFGADAGETVQVWFSPPARMPLGLTVGAATAAGRLHLVFRYRHLQFGPEAAQRFADGYLAELDAYLAEP